MRKPLTHFSIGAALAVIVFSAACTKTGDEVPYCDPSDQSWTWLQRRGTMQINLERGLIYGDDTSEGIYPLLAGHFAGFDGGFPLLLFSDSVDPSEIQGDIVVNDIVFRFSPIEDSFGDLWLITAKPTGDEEKLMPPQRSKVLYSTADGVLWIGFSVLFDEKVYPVNYVPCSKRTLRYEDLRLFADASD